MVGAEFQVVNDKTGLFHVIHIQPRLILAHFNFHMGGKRGEGKGDILLFCLGSWAYAGSQPEFQAHAVRSRHPRETHPAARCRG